MRALFMFLRVVAALISLSLIALGTLVDAVAVWLGWPLPRDVADINMVLCMAAFGALLLYLGARVLREQARMFLARWGGLDREPTLPPARLVLR
jgi:hypothetical protein